MKLAIKNSLDWIGVETELVKLGKMLPEFKHYTTRIINHLREEVTKLSQLEVEHRRRNSSATMSICQRQADKINLELRKVEQFHLMALLAK